MITEMIAKTDKTRLDTLSPHLERITSSSSCFYLCRPGMDDWDQAELEKVVREKHGKQKVHPTTNIVRTCRKRVGVV